MQLSKITNKIQEEIFSRGYKYNVKSKIREKEKSRSWVQLSCKP